MAEPKPPAQEGNGAAQDLGHKRRGRPAVDERQLRLAVRLAQEGLSDSEIGWELAKLIEDDRAREAWDARAKRLGSHRGDAAEAWFRSATNPAPRFRDPAQAIEPRTVRRRIADGCELLGVELPADRAQRGRAKQGAIQRAQRAWLEHEARATEAAKAGRPPERDPVLIRLTAATWRLSAEVRTLFGQPSESDLAQAGELDGLAAAVIRGSKARRRLWRRFGWSHPKPRGAWGDPVSAQVARNLDPVLPAIAAKLSTIRAEREG